MATNMSKEKKSGYLKNVRSELKKVSWPSMKTVINYTIVVMVMVLISATIIGALDFVFKSMFHLFA